MVGHRLQLHTRASLEVPVELDGLGQVAAGGRCVVTGKGDLGEIVEGRLLLRGVASVGYLAEASRGGREIAGMHLAGPGVEVCAGRMAGVRRNLCEFEKGSTAVASAIGLHPLFEVDILAIAAQDAGAEWRQREVG